VPKTSIDELLATVRNVRVIQAAVGEQSVTISRILKRLDRIERHLGIPRDAAEDPSST
jgi:hypothetical protein